MQGVLTVGAAFLLSVAGTRLVIDWLKARDLVAVENERTMHLGAVPQGGGVAVVTAILLSLVVFWPWTGTLAVVVPVTVGLASLSAWNDWRDIAFPVRLAAHMVAAGAVIALVPLGPVFGGAVPVWLERVVLGLGLVWFINLTNFMDGIDGITGVEMISIAGGVIAVRQVAGGGSEFDGLTFAILGASAGFLVWNWQKARIILGDVGSIPFGLMTGAILIDIAARQSLAAALILPLYYLTDATLTLLRRLFRGESVWRAHREHAYQRAAGAIGSHAEVVKRIAVCNGVLIGAAVLAVERPWAGIVVAVAAVGILMWHLETLAGRQSKVA